MSREFQLHKEDVKSPWAKNPVVMALGAGTAGVLGYGLYSFSQGGSGMAANRAMRLRVLAQALTVGGMLGYFVIFQSPLKKYWQADPQADATA